MTIEVQLPELGENIERGDIVKWLVAVGDLVQADQPIVEIETGKAVVEVPSTQAGRVTRLHFEEGDAANVGDVMISLDSDLAATVAPAPAVKSAPKSMPKPAPSPAPVLGPQHGDTSLLPATPVVKRMAREAGIDLVAIHGSGPGGRITPADLLTHGAAPAPSPAGIKLPDFNLWGATERKPLTAVRRAVADHLSRSWANTPQVTQFDKADITQLEALRKQTAPQAAARGGKLTLTALALKVCAVALTKFPHFNASLDLAGNAVILKQYVNIGVAVDTDRGLLVPVVRDCHRKGILDLSVDLAQLSARARQAQLSVEEMQGGCFSISNLGGIGGVGFSPIVNGPEVAILGLSRAVLEPVWNGEQFAPRLLLPLALSYDHRWIDGAAAAHFLRFICEAFEQPLLLSL
ncbi:2-oxo acid dehydrogenase subunit E2 [candidate division KSB1 bacterium]|nr:2-oxo acid dehydrogenase subunit E2 [candidate division KSB1 bacterium]